MKLSLVPLLCLLLLAASPLLLVVEASVFLPHQTTSLKHRGAASSSVEARHELRWQLRQQQHALTKSSAMAIPGYGVAEQGAFVLCFLDSAGL